ncbi:probable 6-phosphogluconolactonase 4, chloroplastic [Phalaenopsis equestris]|uniref:probable 6-phosphogluconolactonase 4, chloroplastic n=1 Tax=Phalaenopsis equestris TaxID=78828 RepID=UPI0009E3103B|nr:probable 6-phosphogluconolactonase 4, chloroplastic [Phalaenopsis equestris]
MGSRFYGISQLFLLLNNGPADRLMFHGSPYFFNLFRPLSSSQSSQYYRHRRSSTMSGEKKQVKIFDTDDDLADGIAKHTVELSRKFSHQRNAFTVVLSGGYLVDKLRKLVEPPYVSEVDWAKWHIFWVDERVMKENDPDSCYMVAKRAFLSKVPIPENQIHSVDDSLNAEHAAQDYEKRVKELAERGVVEISPQTKFPRFDLMLLGIGPDGHLASLFPHHPLLNEKERWVTFIKNSPKPPPVRVTFTLPVIAASAYIFMVVAGSAEADAVKRALEDDLSADLLPVQRVKLENGEFLWFLDRLAASKL